MGSSQSSIKTTPLPMHPAASQGVDVFQEKLRGGNDRYDPVLYPRNEASEETHTMGTSLPRYLEIKVHQTVLERRWDRIVVRGRYARYAPDSLAFDGEKRDKPFNWERPTARVDGDTLYIECFPGFDHVEHYAEIIAGYLKILEGRGDGVHQALTPSSRVCFEKASCSDTLSALRDTNLDQFPGDGVDTVVAGQVWHLPRLTGAAAWEGDGPWQWIVQTLGGRRVAFLGFRPAFWGDISGEVVHLLAARFRIREFLYLGKLGGLKPEVEPNRWLATGDRSLVHGRMVAWENALAPTLARSSSGSSSKKDWPVLEGTHITLGSVLHETKAWHAALVAHVDFVDPEIGMMAQAAVRTGTRFGYLHIVTDNLAKKYDEDLSNERKASVLARRAKLQQTVQDIIEEHLRSE